MGPLTILALSRCLALPWKTYRLLPVALVLALAVLFGRTFWFFIGLIDVWRVWHSLHFALVCDFLLLLGLSYALWRLWPSFWFWNFCSGDWRNSPSISAWLFTSHIEVPPCQCACVSVSQKGSHPLATLSVAAAQFPWLIPVSYHGLTDTWLGQTWIRRRQQM